MKRIEYFCRNIRHDDLIEEQMEEAKKGGIIKSYTLTTLSAMNERRNADICLWCDEIWSAGHLHSCSYVSDHNCVFTCGVDFEVFAFVKVSKEGLKPMLVKESQDELHIPGKTNLFDEVCEPNSCVSPVAELVCDAPKVFDEFPEPNLCFVSASIIEVSVVQKVFDEMSEHVLNSNQLEAPLIDDVSQTRLKNNGGFDVSDSLTDCVSTENLQVLNGHHTFVKMPQANSSLSSDQIVRVVMIGDDQSLLDDINKVQPAVHGVREPKLDEIVPDYVRTVHNLFHKMPVPDFILEMAQAARITQENEEMGDAHQMFDKIPEPTEQAYASQTICQVAMINNENKPSKVLDELPHPHSPFLHAPILDVVVANEGLNIIRQRDDLNEHNDHLKLCALDHPNFTHLVDIFSNGAWLCIPSPLDVKAGLILGLMPQYKVTLHAECSLFQVTTKPFFPCTDTKNEVLWCQKNMALEGVCTMMSGSIFSCVFVFDPVVLLLHMNFDLYMQYCVGVINEWKPQVNYKEIHSWGKLLVGFIWTEGLKNTFQLPSIHNIDAYCLLPSAIRRHILMNVTSNYHGHADMWSIYFRNLNSARLQVLSFPKFILCVIATGGVLTSDMSKVIFNPGGCVFPAVGNTILASIFEPYRGLTHVVFSTLEDKGDFRGEEDTSREYTWHLFNPQTLWSHFSASWTNNGHLFLTFVFDPGILFCQSNLWDVHFHNSWFYSEPSLGLCVGHLTVYVLDACYLKLLLLCKAHTIYHVSIFAPALTTIPEDNGDFTEVRVIRQWRTTWIVKCAENYLIMCCTWLNLLKGVAIMQENFVRSHMFDEHLNISNFIFVPGGVNDNLSAQILNARLLKLAATQGSVKHDWKGMKPLQKLVSSKNMGFETVWVFDPCGDENFFTGESWCTKRTNQTQICQYGGSKQLKDKRNEDIQIYVFDPGGPFVRVVIDDLVTNSQPGRCHVTPCFKY
ncbi:uncharacterized protein LOC141642721 [Silene latifolia]|uniref:uncharacterized protein LOC141642721 n=1 Tax=Silene latifolia TaxID=37657 RepID=UPI003D76E536